MEGHRDHFVPLLPTMDFSKLNEKEKVAAAYVSIPYGSCLFEMGEVEKGLEMTREGIQWMERAFGKYHSRIIEEYLRLGNELLKNRRL